MLQDGILPQDLPSAILDGRKPSAMYLENHSYEEINQKIDDQWYHFTLHNDSAGLPNPSRAWREKADEKTDGALKKFFRYIHDYGLDTLEERFASSGVYFLARSTHSYDPAGRSLCAERGGDHAHPRYGGGSGFLKYPDVESGGAVGL